MNILPLYWSALKQDKHYEEKAAVSLQIDNCKPQLIQIDTGCPVTFVNYDYALKNKLISDNYLETTQNYQYNDRGDKFYFIDDFELKLKEKVVCRIPKCYIEFEQTKSEKTENNIRWENELKADNIGYLGIDFFEQYPWVAFDFLNNKLILFTDEKEWNEYDKGCESNFTFQNGYCIFDIEFSGIPLRALFDTGSASMGLILPEDKKQYFGKHSFLERKIIRNDFIGIEKETTVTDEVKFSNHYKIKGNIKLSFPEGQMSQYFFDDVEQNCILGLQLFSGKTICLDFVNKKFKIR